MTACSSVQQNQPQVTTAAPLAVYAAGSLRGALTAIARDYETSTGQKVALTFGASGLLRERIEKGELAQVFASADNDHPQRLARQGGWQPSTVFVRNSLCALTRDKLDVTTSTLLEVLLRPDVRLGTSTPKADPSGDYTWALFHKAEALHKGAYAVLDAKAIGASWQEQHRGTNAIGTALAEGCSIAIHGAEHFFERHEFLTCTATPIVSATGQLLGVLDISGDHRAVSHAHTYGLVNMAVRLIENRLISAARSPHVHVHLHLHAHREGIGTVAEGIVLVSGDG